ncbi:hypothetical protein PRZ48_006206 [Zasmidium cellare]|uniref:Uncharacterized protein n=1 Tax=Zasmidium cellare TaxID=395010 RepID=A0ABR0ENG2_ZASCE|nr:hypothetical protein PRZ48_006206 [Zasmidium cellare]
MADQQATGGEDQSGLDGCPAGDVTQQWADWDGLYDPVKFGHPHEQAEEQVTEPFHWQLPNWARPGYQLYHYPGYGYFDHPLYTTQTPDGRTLVASYESAQRFSRPPVSAPSEPTPTRPRQEMVDVYYSDEFVEEVPQKLLIRFSNMASVAFLKTRKSGHGHDKQSERSVSPPSTIADSVMDGAIRGLENTTPTAPKKPRDISPSTTSDFTAFDTCSTSRSRSDTRTTDLTIPEKFEDISYVKDDIHIETQPHVEGGKRRRRRRRRGGAQRGKKELRLDLNVREAPTKDAVRAAIAWMKTNEDRHGDHTLPYGPNDLSNLDLEDIVDLYQAALAFGLQPWPRRLKLELNERITRTRLDFETFVKITRWLPMADSALARALNQVDYHMIRARYTLSEMEDFEMYISTPGNETLQARTHELRVVGQRLEEMNINLHRGDSNSHGVHKLQENKTPRKIEARNNCAEKPHGQQQDGISESPDRTPRNDRKRSRRKRRSEWKSSNGDAVPGANYA